MLPLLLVIPSVVSVATSLASWAFASQAKAAKAEAASAQAEAQAARDLTTVAHKNVGEAIAEQNNNIKKVLSVHIDEVEKMEKEILTAKSNTFSYTETAKLYADTAKKHKDAAKQHAEEASKESTQAQVHAENAETFATTAGEHSDKAANHSTITLRNVQKAAIESPGVIKCSRCSTFSARYFVTEEGKPVCANCDPKEFAARKG